MKKAREGVDNVSDLKCAVKHLYESIQMKEKIKVEQL